MMTQCLEFDHSRQCRPILSRDGETVELRARRVGVRTLAHSQLTSLTHYLLSGHDNAELA